MRKIQYAIIFLLSLVSLDAANATETVTYTYDALGRLVQASSIGSTNNGLSATSTYDAAGNRTNYSVSGSPNTSSVRGVIVLPIAGMFIMPLGVSQ